MGYLLTSGDPSQGTEGHCRQTKLLGFGILKSILTSYMEMQCLKFDLLVIHLDLAKCFFAMLGFLPSGMEMHNLSHWMLEVRGLHFHFNLTECYCEEAALSLKRDFDLLQGIECDRLWGFIVGLNAFLHYDMAKSLWGPGSGKQWFE